MGSCLVSVGMACTTAGAPAPADSGAGGVGGSIYGSEPGTKIATGGIAAAGATAGLGASAGSLGAGGTNSSSPRTTSAVGASAGMGATGGSSLAGSGNAGPFGGSSGTLASGGRSAGGGIAASGGTANRATGFITEDFESATPGQPPPGWDTFIAYNKNGPNPSGTTLALVDDTRVHAGSKALHVHGGTSPALITRPLPVGTNKLYARVWVYMTRQLGNHPMSSNPNHETVLGIRAVTNAADDEVRFGEIKGVIGTNVPKLSDNISPPQPSWYSGPSVPANTWACIEVAFLGDTQPNSLHAWANGTLVHEITDASDWNAPGMPPNWLNGEFTEFIMGWHSFSNNEVDAWFDDLVLSSSPIGCD